MIELTIKIERGAAKHGIVVLAKYKDTERLAYILTGTFSGSKMQIHDFDGVLLAKLTKIPHTMRKDEWRLDFEDKRPSILFKPQGSAWTVESEGESWEIGDGNLHQVTSGSTKIGMVETSKGVPGANGVSAVDEKHVLTLVGFAGTLYLRDHKQSKPASQYAGVGMFGIQMASC